MSNTYFQFRQFRIEQQHCAMKVTTDACIQGAWTPIQPHVKRVLDIGAGTGLVSLMLAQRNPGILIDAIELDTAATAQATENISASPWHDRICILQGDATNYPFPHKYDLIICNPPFFSNSLLSSTQQKTMARHTLSLSQNDLFTIINDNLTDDGYASILLPIAEYQQWHTLIKNNGWHEVGKLSVSHTPGAQVKRVVSLCSKNVMEIAGEHQLVIKDSNQQYTPDFTALLSPFYLQL